ncbi:MAG: hypothetical protein QG670_1857 [Thermoproteota archaeon]|nr:hypothetical protein [Thermoproteota archaeon]
MSESIVTKLSFVEGYSFKVEFDLKEIPTLIVDEAKPIGEGLGPSPTRLLSASIGHCLSSSLLYCLRRAKVNIKGLETTVKADTERNEKGRLRIKNIDVKVHLVLDEKDKPKVNSCLEVFEDYCTLTQSVRKGIEVNVSIADI